MSWFKVDDGFAAHPKVLGIPRARRHSAVGLWTLAGTWSARSLTDGVIPGYMLDELGAADDAVKDLLAARLWEETADGYLIHDYLDYNPSREKVLAERDAAAERQRQARERAAEKRKASQDAAARASQRESQRDTPPDGFGVGTDIAESGQEHLPLGGVSQRDSRVTTPLRHGAPDRESQPPHPTPPDPTPPVSTKTKPKAARAAGPPKDTPEGRIADAVYERLDGMITWVAVSQVAKRAMRVKGATEDRIVEAMCAIDAAGKPITLQTVGQFLSGALNLGGPPHRDEPPRVGAGVWDRVANNPVQEREPA